jgi:hypothetical protein
MDLIERYLHAVRTHLPQGKQDDVVAELAEDLRSRVEEREAELGRGLTEDEAAELLRQLGHPAHLASRYGSWQQLIGPALFPAYKRTLKITLGIALLANVVLAIVLAAVGRPVNEAVELVVKFPFVTAMVIFGWVTLIFALIDAKAGPETIAQARRDHASLFERWDPRSLPPVPRHPRGAPRWVVALDLVAAVLLLAWWLAVPSDPWLMFGPAAAFLSPGPGLLAAYVPVAVAGAIGVALRLYGLWRPDLRKAIGVLCNLASLVGLAILVGGGGPYVVALPGSAAHPDLARAMPWLDRSFAIGFVLVAAVTAYDVVKDGRALLMKRRQAPASAGASTPQGSPR